MSLTLVRGVIRAWTGFYTKGLPAELAAKRRAEIESDLWEHELLWKESGLSGLSGQCLSRWLLGIPADLSWRLEQKGSSRNTAEDVGSKLERRIKLSGITAQKVMFGLVLLVAAYQALIVFVSGGFGLGFWGGGEGDPGNGWYYTLPICLAGVVLIWAGLRERVKAPFRSGVLIAIGVLPSILMFWMMIPPVIALVVAVYSILHGRNQQRLLTSSA